MISLVIFSLYASLTLYILLAGADFGAGILELFTPKRHRQYVETITARAIGPVWEANHVWLILVIVILFTGFPKLHTLLVTHLHLPILLLLLGIILRGTAFVFRHYDAVKDGMQRHYRNAFIYSSLLTPLCLGVIAGAGIRGDFPADPVDFYSGFIAPWWNWFSLSVGGFTIAICGYLAAVFLMAEMKKGSERKRYGRLSIGFLIGMVVFGGLAFLLAALEDLAFFTAFFGNSFSIAAVILATLTLPLMAYALSRDRFLVARVLAGGQVVMILVAVYVAMFPHFVLSGGLGQMDLYATAAPEASIQVLGWSLIGGLSIIAPSVGYLMWVFKGQSHPNS